MHWALRAKASSLASPPLLPSTVPLMPNELLVSMQAGSAVINLAWASGPLGQGVCHAQLSEAGHLSWEQPLALGQARLVLRDLTPGRYLFLSVLCQAGPLQASTHPVVLPVGTLARVGGGGAAGFSPGWGPAHSPPSHLLFSGGGSTLPSVGICFLYLFRWATMPKGGAVSLRIWDLFL